MPAPHTHRLQVEVEGSPLPSDMEHLLVSATVDDNLNLPDMFVLTFSDPGHVVLDKTGLDVGKKVKIGVVSSESPAGEELMTGEVTAVESEFTAAGAVTVVRGFDHSHRLFRGRRTESYTNVLVSDIVRTVARRAGLETDRIDPTTTLFDHVTQANSTDWAFLQQLARECGYQLGVEDGKLSFESPLAPEGALSLPDLSSFASAPPTQLTLGGNLLRLRAVKSAAQQVREVQVQGWDERTMSPLRATSEAATTSVSMSARPADLAEPFDAPPLISVSPPLSTQSQVDAAAAALADRVASAAFEFEGEALGDPRLTAGAEVTFALVGSTFEGTARLSAARHVYDPDVGYTTSFSVSGSQDRSFLGLTQDNGGAEPATMSGVVPAIVTNVQDPDQRCRVKLKFPWLSDSYESEWARTVNVGAGSARGHVALPEVDDEVLVAFEQGDIRYPFVVGGLYNGTQKPGLPDGWVSSSGEVAARGIQSRSAHRIVFCDGLDGNESVVLATGDNKHWMVFDQKRGKVRIHSDGTIEIEATGDIAVTGAAISVTASDKLELTGRSVAISGSTGIDIDAGGSTVSVSGSQIRLN